MMTSNEASLLMPNLDTRNQTELIYKPLGSLNYDIRILTVAPGPEESPIRCVLTTRSLINPGEYIALSYHWGDPANTTQIFVNGIPRNVTLNLQEALWHLRARGVFRIWADAVCINQDDLEERSLQVRLMKKIYMRAHRVVCWLGTGLGRSFRIIKFLSNISEKERNLARFAMPYDARKLLEEFFDRPYWKRAWIIQEVAVGSSVSILSGFDEMELKTLDSLRSWLNTSAPYFNIVANFRSDYQYGSRPEVLNAMERSKDMLVTDIRDKIFALLGLCHDGEDLILCPNYMQPIEDLLRDFTRSIIKSKKHPHSLLYQPTKKKRPLKMPSWVPDWLGIWSDPSSLLRGVRKTYYMPLYEFLLSESTDPNILRISGVVVDTIAGLIDEIDSRASRVMARRVIAYYGSYSRVGDAIWDILSLKRLSRNDREISRTLFSTLWSEDGRITTEKYEFISKKIFATCSDSHLVQYVGYDFLAPIGLQYNSPGFEQDLKDKESRERGVQRMQEFIDWILRLRSLNIAGKSIEDWAQVHPKGSTKQSPSQTVFSMKSRYGRNFEYLASIVENEAKLVVTEQGAICMAHAEVCVGDRVCLLGGLEDPIILREVEGSEAGYRVVGGIFPGASEHDELHARRSMRQWFNLC